MSGVSITPGDLISYFSKHIGAEKVLSGDRLALRHSEYCAEAYDCGVLLLPETTQDVSAICAAATEAGVSVVPHGGLTGLVDGTGSHPGQVAISFERMNKILRVDPLQGVAIVEAGVVLQDLIDATTEQGLQPGVVLPSRGTCTLGGMVATNAGGIQAIKYGMMRDNILGLTVVLASGEVLDLNNTLVKNNAGYDLKQMFIGAEGTLGLITQIVVRLHPVPRDREVALIGC
ncbi:MAG: FAD-binding oxidoreductase [Albidovulum sp.]